MDIVVFVSVILTYIGMLTSDRKRLGGVQPVWTFLLILAALLSIYFAPFGFDRKMYEIIYLNPESFSKDQGWIVYNRIVRIVAGENSNIFFLINDILYTGGFVYFTFKTFNRDYAWYYLVIVFISIGYYSGGSNVLRSGLALSLIFYGLGLYMKYRNIIPLLICALMGCMIHLSTILIACALVVAYLYPKYKLYLGIWCLFLVLSYFNTLGFVSDTIIDLMGDDSYRLQGYLDGPNDLYKKAGFRFDFIVYSAVPIVFGLYYLVRKKFMDRFYIVIFSAYFLINSIWLVVIRMPYTDRMALMSWIFIPIIIAYPPLKGQMSNQRQMIFLSILFPFSLHLYFLFL